LNAIPNAQASLSVRFAPGGRACVVFQAERGEGPRSGAIPTLTGALLASTLARMGPTPQAEQLLRTAERAAEAFASMRQPSFLPDDMTLVDADELGEAETMCTMLLPAEGDDFVKSVFATEDPDVAYRSFLYSLQYAVENLPPEALVALSSVLKGVTGRFRSGVAWPDAPTIERELAAGKAGITGQARH